MINGNGRKSDIELFDIEKYSSDVQSMMTAPPNWMLRWGIGAIFLILFVIFMVSFFVRYPDLVKTGFTLTSYSPSVKIVSKSAGRITLFVKDKEEVHKKQVIGYIENTASYPDIRYLMEAEDLLRSSIFSGNLDAISLKPDIQLGELQDAYIRFLTAVKLYKAYMAENKLTKNIAALNKQKQLYEEIGKGMERQAKLIEKQNAINSIRLKRDSLLFAEKVISAADIENSKLSQLPAELSSENSRQSVTTNSLRIAEIDNKKIELNLQEARFLNDLNSNIITSYIELVKSFQLWQDRYLFIAPIDGAVALFDARNDNEYIPAAKEIINITPLAGQKPVGVCMLPVQNSGKVKVGQDVSIDFSNFPANEFGLVKGKVRSISTIPQGGMYLVFVEFTDGLNSDLKNQIAFKEQMTGTASIVTEDLRLIERFFYSFRKILATQ